MRKFIIAILITVLNGILFLTSCDKKNDSPNDKDAVARITVVDEKGVPQGGLPVLIYDEEGYEKFRKDRNTEAKAFTVTLPNGQVNYRLPYSEWFTAGSRLVAFVIREELGRRGCDVEFDVASNPEFLKEGAAIKDFMSPDRVVVGVESERARTLMSKLYRPFLINNYRVLFMDISSAEMTKYAANAMLATRISFMNDIANLCDHVGADVEMVRKGIGADARIGTKFLYPGCGYGGSCFPKDVKALAHTGREYGYTMEVIEAVERVNEAQKSIVFEKLQRALGDLAGRRVAIWGVAFKPETDDVREAPATEVIRRLLGAGAEVVVCDPVAVAEFRRRHADLQVRTARTMYEAAEGADAVALLTEWKEFRMPDWTRLRESMRGDVVVDGRNIYDKQEVRTAGFRYFGIGK